MRGDAEGGRLPRSPVLAKTASSYCFIGAPSAARWQHGLASKGHDTIQLALAVARDAAMMNRSVHPGRQATWASLPVPGTCGSRSHLLLTCLHLLACGRLLPGDEDGRMERRW